MNGNPEDIICGFLFDVYLVENTVYLWVLSDDRRIFHFKDTFYPEIFVDAPPDYQRRFARRLYELNALAEKPHWTSRKHFYRNEEIKVARYVLSKPSLLKKISRRLFHFYSRAEVYHSDMEPSFLYFLQKNIYPASRVKIIPEAYNRIKEIFPAEDPASFEYPVPHFRIMEMSLRKSHRMFYSPENSLCLKVYYENEVEFAQEYPPAHNPAGLLLWLNSALQKYDPDIILSSFGDQIIFPELFFLSQKYKIPLLLDRELLPIKRVIHRKGSSYSSYGNTIYRAPSYPLFGRWHIDSKNSFLYKESDLLGIIELSRISRIPVQKMARSSTGAALTQMQSEIALRNNYLVPWQKSHIEEPRKATELLRIDKGGLVYEPDIYSQGNVLENIAQIDFEQMYPTIMVIHNISPETVLCDCCRNDPEAGKVPESKAHICRRRRGVVSLSIEPLLARRKYLKEQKKILKSRIQEEKNPVHRKELKELRRAAETRQISLKWLLVTCFGYLGYRNAKFGRLESHEAVQAFGRQKLITAKEIAEKTRYSLVHAITDCLFLKKDPETTPGEFITEKDLEPVFQEIKEKTGVGISLDGVYSWLVFLPSKGDPGFPVANRYFGRFTDGELKLRGLLCRHKDIPVYIKRAQMGMLTRMKKCVLIRDLKNDHFRMEKLYRHYDRLLKEEKIPFRYLYFRRNIGRALEDYRVDNAGSVSVRQILNMNRDDKNFPSVLPGEKVEYLLVRGNEKYAAREIAEKAPEKIRCHIPEYRRWLLEAYKEIWEPFAPEGYFDRNTQEFLSKQGTLFPAGFLPSASGNV